MCREQQARNENLHMLFEAHLSSADIHLSWAAGNDAFGHVGTIDPMPIVRASMKRENAGNVPGTDSGALIVL